MALSTFAVFWNHNQLPEPSHRPGWKLVYHYGVTLHSPLFPQPPGNRPFLSVSTGSPVPDTLYTRPGQAMAFCDCLLSPSVMTARVICAVAVSALHPFLLHCLIQFDPSILPLTDIELLPCFGYFEYKGCVSRLGISDSLRPHGL